MTSKKASNKKNGDLTDEMQLHLLLTELGGVEYDLVIYENTIEQLKEKKSQLITSIHNLKQKEHINDEETFKPD